MVRLQIPILTLVGVLQLIDLFFQLISLASIFTHYFLQLTSFIL